MVVHVCDLCKKQISERDHSIAINFMPPRGAQPTSQMIYAVPTMPAASMEICESCGEKAGLMKRDDVRPNVGALTQSELEQMMASER